MNHESKRPITVEDLLRLKRAERPPAEFWDEFNRELRAKQLAALVEKTPWWRALPRAFAGATRYALPVGATAVLAVTFFATRDDQPVGAPFAPVGVETVSATQRVSEEVLARQADIPGMPQVAVTMPAPELSDQMPKVDEVLAPAREAQVFAALADKTADEHREIASEELSPSARHIAANLALAQAGTPTIAGGLLGATRSLGEPTESTRAAVEPLAQVSTPAERSRARFATAMVASFAGDSRGRAASANVARRISDERVYDDGAIRRVGATGNSVAWRF